MARNGLQQYFTSENVDMGTTLIAMEFDGGVVVGTDSRTSSGTYISSRATDKITPITDRIVVCRSGSAADTQAISDVVKYYIEVYSMMEEEDVTVGRCAQIFRNFLYKYRDSLSASVLVAGYDDIEGGQLYAVPLGGYVTRQRCASSGSGSTFVQGFLDSQWKPGMTVEKCKEIVLYAVALATIRDGSSGGVIRLAVIDKTGTQKMAITAIMLVVFGAESFLDEENVIPDLAPHIDNPMEFEFIEDIHKKHYLKSLFTESFYEPNCDGKPNVTIKPIYFWPGQRIDLRCVMCRRAFTFNGLMKHWWFMPAKEVEDALGDMKNLKNSPKWNQHLMTLSADFGDNRWRDFGAMPNSFGAATNPRSQTVFIQRNGMLILLQVVSDKNMNEEMSWNLHGYSKDAKLAEKFVNLKIQLQWSEWSSCEQGTIVRTREGHCYLKKIDPSKDIGQLVDGAFAAYDLFNWVKKLKNHMSEIPEFNTTGIRLYSGLISKLIHEGAFGDDKSYDDCYSVRADITMKDMFFKRPKATKRWINAIFAAFGIDNAKSMLKMSDRLCLYYYNKPTIRRDKAPASVFVGTHLVDTQRCSVL
ncbi:unnamed protein product [Acanthocheilonema viteae]|uniref:proteasome endopeptidase complex n=1 Tax=Acanthocheilonema viteae TaxID=6277 RepID=A0A498SF82_ACAVI|nr:unnamed protein product [Acanthocheilonema viteae]